MVSCGMKVGLLLPEGHQALWSHSQGYVVALQDAALPQARSLPAHGGAASGMSVSVCLPSTVLLLYAAFSESSAATICETERLCMARVVSLQPEALQRRLMSCHALCQHPQSAGISQAFAGFSLQ